MRVLLSSMHLMAAALLTAPAIASYEAFLRPVLTVGSLLDFINSTSIVSRPGKHSKGPTRLPSPEGLIRRAGYPAEIHKTETEDGQILTLHRIPGPSKRKSYLNHGPKQPIIVMHGFLGSSNNYLLLPPDRGLVYMLADEGFDVWLGNFRTNYYSRSHRKYSHKDRRLWDVSFHEMGQYDIPAMIDYILKNTGYSQLVYIGHSMGTTSFLIMGSLRPEYNSKVKAAILLSPIALTIRAPELPPLLSSFLLPNANLFYKSFDKLGLYEFFPRNEYFARIVEEMCQPNKLLSLCLFLSGQVFGDNRENYNLNEFGRNTVYSLAGTSIKTAHHISQLFNTGKFRYYDYGAKKNQYRYGSIVPPDYPVHRVTAPVYMYYGPNDALMTTQSVHRLAKALPNVIEVKAVDDPKFAHLDFVVGKNAKELLYDYLVDLLKSFQTLDNNLSPLFH